MIQPNVLVILTDQLALQAIGAYGNAWVNTPNIDALAVSGLRFEKSYCSAPVCSPSRSSLLSGRMPHETGIEVNGPGMHADIPNLGDLFQNAGYETAYIGKWGVGTYRGFDFLETEYPEGVNRHYGSDTDPFWTDRAVAFLGQKHDKPFLMVASLHNPHDICYWVMDHRHLTEEADVDALPPLPDNFERDSNEPEFITTCRLRTYYGNEANWTTTWDETEWRRYLHAYYQLVERVDREVGRILDALCESGLENETLVVFTSDHGEGMGGHEWVVKLMLYDEEALVPFIIRYPGVIPKGQASPCLVSGIDLVPTLCDYAGVGCPAEVTGVSVKAVIDDLGVGGRNYLVSQLSPDTKQLDMKGRMVRTDRFKYVVFSEGENAEMFFDMDRDSGEKVNLVQDPIFSDEVARHRLLLHDWIQVTGDPFFENRKSSSGKAG